MKTLVFLVSMVLAISILSAQNQGPIPKISRQINSYFSYYPRDKVFLMTDKEHYKPGETIWYRAFVSNGDNQLDSEEGSKLSVGLYDKMGASVIKDVYKLNEGSASGDFLIPGELAGGFYFLVAYTSVQSSQDQISVVPLRIEHQYGNQWVVDAVAKDSVSISGKPNELFLILRNFSGDIQKNEQLRYEIRNGSEALVKDKVKTNDSGKATIPFTIPAKTNGEPFVCKLSDQKGEWKRQVFLPTNIDPVIVKFFPEGGNLVAGVPTRIGFTAFNKWGIPVEIEGSVLDQQGEKITPVKTLTKGLGLFSINNPAQQKLRLLISGKEGQNQSFELPAPVSDGLAVSVVKTDAEFIYTNLVFADNQKHPVALTVTHGNEVYWAADMEINGSGRLKIPTSQLPLGINLLSVFSKEGNLLAERIVFKDNKQSLKITVQPEKSTLQAGGKTMVKVRLTNENDQPVSGNVAISVSDSFRNERIVSQIDDYLLVESEVETPFSLFPEPFKSKIGNPALMDVFLIANRIKGFDWARIRQFNPENASFANVANFKISGFVTDKSGAKVSKAKVSMVNNKNMQIHTTTTNSEGVFSFSNLNMSNIDDFSAKATDQEGKHELKVNLIKNLEGQIAVHITDNLLKYELLDREQVADENYLKNNEDLFPRAPKVLKANSQDYENQRKLLSSSTSILDVIKTIKPFKITNNQIVFFGSENSLNYQGGALIVLDGQQLGTDVSVITSLSPADVDHINVSTNPMDIQRYTGLNSVGVIEIFQKRAKIVEQEPKKEGKNKYDGEFRIANVFPAETVNPKRDTRTTLLWIPEQKVDESGLFEFSVTAGKVISDFVIKVQGISPDGRMGTGTASFSVTK